MDTLGKIALSLVPGLSAPACRRLVARCPAGDPFALSASELQNGYGLKASVATTLAAKGTHARAEALLRDAERHGLRILFFTDTDYPARLNRDATRDCPVLLYALGKADLGAARTVAVVGTRRATLQGREATATLVAGMKTLAPTVVSGLAYGIDTAAHEAALDNGLPTVAVLGHGLDRIYPPQNRTLAMHIIEHGGALLSEYPMGTAINPRHFPARNRIIAALADATVVVEAAQRGGALITAAIAEAYGRPVLAVPGRLSDPYAEGTNNLIATGHARMMRHTDDLANAAGWPTSPTLPHAQQLALTLPDPDAQRLIDTLTAQGDLSADALAYTLDLPLPRVAALLFELEADGHVVPLPGRMYHLMPPAPQHTRPQR